MTLAIRAIRGREYESKAENNLVYAAGLALFSMLRGSDPD